MNTSAKKTNKPKKSQGKRRAPSAVRRVHRRLGVASAIVIIFLSISGVVLNHLSFFYSSQSYISSQWLLDWYGVKEPALVYAYQFDSSIPKVDQNPSDIIWADGMILINQKPVLFDQQVIIGTRRFEGIIYLFTQNSVHLFTEEGQKIESARLTSLDGMLFSQASTVNDRLEIVALQLGQNNQFFNLDEMEFVIDDSSLEGQQLDNNLKSSSSFTELDAQLAREFILLKSKVLLDFHSGRFFGRLGPVVMDLFALIFLVIAISGLYLWVKRKYLR